MRTELQYNLQKARALATELRTTLEAIQENEEVWEETLEESWDTHSDSCEVPSDIVAIVEGWLDSLDNEIIGGQHVRLTVEPYNVR